MPSSDDSTDAPPALTPVEKKGGPFAAFKKSFVARILSTAREDFNPDLSSSHRPRKSIVTNARAIADSSSERKIRKSKTRISKPAATSESQQRSSSSSSSTGQTFDDSEHVRTSATGSTTRRSMMSTTRMRGLSVRDELVGIPLPGFSQAIAAEGLVNRITWFVLFTTACSLLVWNLAFLYNQYQSETYNPEVNLREASFVFPDFYICHSIIPSVSLIRYHLNTDPDAMDLLFRSIHLFQEKARQVALNLTTRSDSQDLLNFWLRSGNKRLDTTVLLSSFPDESYPLKVFSHSPSQTIISAFLNERKLLLSDFEVVPHREYYSCLKFRNSSLLASKNDILYLYLYLDESQLFKLKDADLEFLDISNKGYRVFDKSEGIELIFSADHHNPGHQQLVLKAAPGTSTRISIKMVKTILVKSRKNDCNEKPKTFLIANPLHKSGPPIEYQLDSSGCISYKVSKILYEKCACVEANDFLPYELANKARRCHNASLFSPYEIATNIMCTFRFKYDKNKLKSIEDECRNILSCTFQKYESTSSYGTWPAVAHISKFVLSVMIPTYKARKAHGLIMPAWENVINAEDNQSAMVRANVAKVQIHPASSRSLQIKDQEVYPVFNFLSDVGGVFGLFLDISFLSFCGVFQTLYRVYKIFRQTPLRRKFRVHHIPMILKEAFIRKTTS